MTVSVCLSVCLSARISQKPHVRRTLSNFLSMLPVVLARTDLLWQRCNMLYTSGFVDDVIFL